MKLIDILDKQKHSNLLQEYEYDMNYQPIDKTSHKGSKERLTTSELEELMDVNRQTYKRVNGRVRRK